MKEPVSTYTNIAYPLVGLTLFGTAPNPATFVFLITLTVLGFGSFMMHKTQDYGWPRQLDVAGMFAAMAALATHALGFPGWGMAIVAGLSAGFLYDAKANVVTYWMATFMAVILAAGIAAQAWIPTFLGGIYMGIGYLFHRSGGDVNHGFWHLFTAVGMGILFLI